MGETDYNALLYDKMKAEQDKYRDWLAGGNFESYLRVHDERGHRDVYGRTGAFSETGKGFASFPLPS